MAERRVIHSAREPAGSFDLLEADQPPALVYADGFAGVGMGTAMSRLGLYQVKLDTKLDEQGRPIEQRVLTNELVVPTEALVEFCANVLIATAQSLPTYEAASKMYLQKLYNLSKGYRNSEQPDSAKNS